MPDATAVIRSVRSVRLRAPKRSRRRARGWFDSRGDQANSRRRGGDTRRHLHRACAAAGLVRRGRDRHGRGSGAGRERVSCAKGGTRPVLGVRDRDLLNDTEVDEICRGIPNLFVWPGRCLENDLLHPPLLVSAVRSTAAEINEATVREQLRLLAEQHRDEMVAHLADRRLRDEMPDEPRPRARTPSVGCRSRAQMTSRVRLQVRLQDRRDAAQRRVDAYARVHQEVSSEIADRFEAEHLALLDGKRALRQLGADLNPFRTADQLEALLVKHIQEGLVPPGFAALFQRLTTPSGALALRGSERICDAPGSSLDEAIYSAECLAA